MPLVCVWEQAVLLCYRRSARIGRRSAARYGLRRRQQSLDVARTFSYDAISAGLMRISWTGSPQAAGEEWYFMVHLQAQEKVFSLWAAEAKTALRVLYFCIFRSPGSAPSPPSKSSDFRAFDAPAMPGVQPDLRAISCTETASQRGGSR